MKNRELIGPGRKPSGFPEIKTLTAFIKTAKEKWNGIRKIFCG